VVYTLQSLIVCLRCGLDLILHGFVLKHRLVKQLEIVLLWIIRRWALVFRACEEVQVAGELRRGSEILSEALLGQIDDTLLSGRLKDRHHIFFVGLLLLWRAHRLFQWRDHDRKILILRFAEAVLLLLIHEHLLVGRGVAQPGCS
jgi:hypothetical protein